MLSTANTIHIDNPVKLAVLLMIKDESSNLIPTLESASKISNTFFVYDTGSSAKDDSPALVRNYCKDKGITLFLKEHETDSDWFDFAWERNTLIQFAELTNLKEELNIELFFMIDAGDVISIDNRGIKNEKEYLDYVFLSHSFDACVKSDRTAFYVNQLWKQDEAYLSFKNIKIWKPYTGWHYTYPVHEVLENDDKNELVENFVDGIVLYQDRNNFCDDTLSRIPRDIKMLREWLKKPTTQSGKIRNQFYLAQSLSCVDDYKEAIVEYEKYLDLKDPFTEQRYIACQNLGCLYMKINNPDKALKTFLKGITLGIKRPELYYYSALVYLDQKRRDQTKLYLERCIDVDVKQENCLLPLDEGCQYKAQHLLDLLNNKEETVQVK